MTVKFPTIMIPQGNGDFLIRAGRPVETGEEVTVREAATLLKLSVRRINELCDVGKIKSRRPSQSSSPNAKRLIPASEIHRMLQPE